MKNKKANPFTLDIITFAREEKERHGLLLLSLVFNKQVLLKQIRRKRMIEMIFLQNKQQEASAEQEALNMQNPIIFLFQSLLNTKAYNYKLGLSISSYSFLLQMPKARIFAAKKK